MRLIYITLFFALSSCQTAPKSRTGYLISEYDSNGKVSEVYNVGDYELLGDKVEFSVDGKKSSISGSFKIEKIEN